MQIQNICSKLVKPILIVGGAIPIILAIIIVIPLVTAPEIANTAIDPLDESEIEFTVHQLRNMSPGIIDRLTAVLAISGVITSGILIISARITGIAPATRRIGFTILLQIMIICK